MKKIKTTSYFVTIYEFKDKKIVKRRKRKGTHAYPRTISLYKINKCLKGSSINYPLVLFNSFNFVYEEYINSNNNIINLSNIDIMNKVIDIIVSLSKVKVNKKYINWNDNSSFLKFQIDNLKEVISNKKTYNIDKYYNELDILYQSLDNNRPLVFIHGDIHRNNIILNDNKFYLIDWELATFGDLAYELATHFILMNYNDYEKELFIKRLSDELNLPFDILKLKQDIDVYTRFETLRRKILNELKR